MSGRRVLAVVLGVFDPLMLCSPGVLALSVHPGDPA